jgi:hypothetical protein
MKNNLRQQVSQVLDTLIPEGQWDKYVDMLDREGKFTRKSELSIILLLCKQIEVLEDKIEILESKKK